MNTHFLGDGCATHSTRPEEVTTSEIAQRLKEDRKAVNRWIERSTNTGFPNNLGRRYKGNGRGWLYDWEEVEAWYTYWKLTRRSSGKG